MGHYGKGRVHNTCRYLLNILSKLDFWQSEAQMAIWRPSSPEPAGGAYSALSSWISYIREQKAGVEGEGMPREGGRAR